MARFQSQARGSCLRSASTPWSPVGPQAVFPIPQVGLRIDPPVGVPEPEVTESIGGTTTVNSDTRVRIWVVQIPETGTYDISHRGKRQRLHQSAARVRPRQFLGGCCGCSEGCS